MFLLSRFWLNTFRPSPTITIDPTQEQVANSHEELLVFEVFVILGLQWYNQKFNFAVIFAKSLL